MNYEVNITGRKGTEWHEERLSGEAENESEAFRVARHKMWVLGYEESRQLSAQPVSTTWIRM